MGSFYRGKNPENVELSIAGAILYAPAIANSTFSGVSAIKTPTNRLQAGYPRDEAIQDDCLR